MAGQRTFDFLLRSRNLDSIERCSNTPHISRYPVSTHTFYTALYSMVFADIENARSSSKIYDTSEVVKKALLHDMEETVTGDILYPVKHGGSNDIRNMFKEIATKCVDDQVFNGLPEEIKEYYIDLWKTGKDETPEGELVSAVDKFEILIYAVIEFNLGNKNFKDMAITASKIILDNHGSIKSLCEEVKYIMSNILNEREVMPANSIRPNLDREDLRTFIENMKRRAVKEETKITINPFTQQISPFNK